MKFVLTKKYSQYIYIYIYIYIYQPSRLRLKNTPTVSLQRGKTPTSTSVLDMVQNDLMMRIQSWSFRKLWITPSLPLLPSLLCSGLKHLIESSL